VPEKFATVDDSTGSFPLGQPIPYDLIARVVALLVAQRADTRG